MGLLRGILIMVPCAILSRSAVGKLANPLSSCELLRRIGWQLECKPTVKLLAFGELLVAFTLILAPLSVVARYAGLAIAGVLGLIFTSIQLNILHNGAIVSCGCFGKSDPISIHTLIAPILLAISLPSLWLMYQFDAEVLSGRTYSDFASYRHLAGSLTVIAATYLAISLTSSLRQARLLSASL